MEQAPITKPYIAPRIVRNKTALDKYLAENQIKSLWPAIESQHEAIAIQGLPAGAYNPSIIRFRGRLLMTYRFHETTLKTKLGIAELDEKFQIFYSETLNLDEDETLSVEDARLFVWKGDLWMNYVVSNWPNFPASQSKLVKLYKPDHWRFSDKEQYWLPDRQTMEKNHVPLVHDEVFQIIYKQSLWQDNDPDDICQVVYSPFEKREMKTPALRWAYGEVRGGTPPLPYGDKLISFFHSRLDNEMPPARQRYYMGAILRNPGKPFDMLAISKKPILRGSEIGGDAGRFHFKANVVFPLGAVDHNGAWLVSVGQNDSAALLVRIKQEELNL